MKKLLRLTSLVVTFALVAFYLPCILPSAQAHEMYYQSGSNPTGVPIKFAHLNTNNKVDFKVSISGVTYIPNSIYTKQVTSSDSYYALNNWSNAYSKISLSIVPVYQAYVDMYVPSTQEWDTKYGSRKKEVVGEAFSYSSNGLVSDTASALDAYNNGGIIYVCIWMSPYGDVYNGFTNKEAAKKAAVVHELGHALCLGHPNVTYYPTQAASIMRTPLEESYTIPQAHDIADLSGKY